MNKHLRALTCINTKLTRLHFSLRKDIINYKDINLNFSFNNSSIYFLINIYSDNHQLALKYFKNTEINLNNILIIIGDFKIRNNNWNSSYSHHSNHTDFLKKIANSLNLKLSLLMQYANNLQDSNLVLNLIFLYPNTKKFNNHFILPNFQKPFDYTPLSIHIIIKEEFIQEKSYYNEKKRICKQIKKQS